MLKSYETREEAEEAPWEIVIEEKEIIPFLEKKGTMVSKLGFMVDPEGEEEPPYYKFIYVDPRSKRASRVLRHEIGHTITRGSEYLLGDEFRTIYWGLKRIPGNSEDLDDLVRLRRFYTRGVKDRDKIEFVVDLERRAAEAVGVDLYPPIGYPKWIKEEFD